MSVSSFFQGRSCGTEKPIKWYILMCQRVGKSNLLAGLPLFSQKTEKKDMSHKPSMTLLECDRSKKATETSIY